MPGAMKLPFGAIIGACPLGSLCTKEPLGAISQPVLPLTSLPSGHIVCPQAMLANVKQPVSNKIFKVTFPRTSRSATDELNGS